MSGQSRLSAALRPTSMPATRSGDSAPMRLPSLERSRVVTWWHRATPGFVRPPDPAGSETAVGPRRAWAPDLDSGTTMIERHPGVRLNASWDTRTTGRRPRCSEPDRGLRSAQKTSPRLTAFASAPSRDATPLGRLPRVLDRGHRDCRLPQQRTRRSLRGVRLFSVDEASSRWRTEPPRWLVDSPVARHREAGGRWAREGEGESFAPLDSCQVYCHSLMATTRAN